MKKYILFLLFTILIACQIELENEKVAYDIILIAGQSNTHGSLGINYELDKPEENIFQLGRYSIFDHMILEAREPLHHHTLSNDKIGFGLTFAKNYKKKLEANKNPILILPCGFGGSSLFTDWDFDNFLYQDLIERVEFVKSKYPLSKLKVILWHQGETDVGNSSYEERLDLFLNTLRRDLKTDCPLILGGMVPYWVSLKEERMILQNILKDTPNRIGNVAYADPTVPYIIEKPNNDLNKIHYDANGQRELGRRYFISYCTIVSKND